ncbi:MAG: hypothetical protein RLZZ499_48, partial [Cyanobacteriota bacterium]
SPVTAQPETPVESPVTPQPETPVEIPAIPEPPLSSSGLQLTLDSLFSGKPNYVPAENNGLFVWHTDNTWNIEGTGDWDGSHFRGKLVADRPIESLSSFDFENNDFVRFTDDSHQVVEFSMIIGNQWTDGISFQTPDDASIFLELEESDRVSVVAGTSMQEINLV